MGGTLTFFLSKMVMRTQFASLWFVLCFFATVRGITIRKSLSPQSFLNMQVIDMHMLNVSCPQTLLVKKWDCLAEIVGADMKLFVTLRQDSRFCPGLRGWSKWRCLAKMAGGFFRKVKAKAKSLVPKIKNKAKGLIASLKKKKETVKAKVSEKKAKIKNKVKKKKAKIKSKVAEKKAKIKNKVKKKKAQKAANADVGQDLNEPKRSSKIKNMAKAGAAAQVVRSQLPGIPGVPQEPVDEHYADQGKGQFGKKRFGKGRYGRGKGRYGRGKGMSNRRNGEIISNGKFAGGRFGKVGKGSRNVPSSRASNKTAMSPNSSPANSVSPYENTDNY